VAKGSFRCKLVTPLASLVNDPVSYASVPAWDGLMGFLPDRAAFLGKLGTGELRLEMADTEKGQGGSRSFVLDGGFVRMADNVLTIMAEKATPFENISSADADAELRAAEAIKDQTERARAVNRAKLMQKVARTSGGKI
jgi:F-type H+-transporting ATPase subunit epsilon